ncbi:hypothetical protein ACR66_04480 [Staphylococcus aureus]|nr:hypothetical protein [Staphylococcus aureus]UUV45300.1 hypothetical protein [Staphylococcus phage SAP3_TA-2022]UUV45362.1 hypothetical protein [Staphylococcus phage SAP8_Andrews]APW51292.1 hypothetical protein LG33_09510 [Staphylococcus aureus]AQQ84411.1 hypothetical protein AYM13_09410 [Staphylococcus aureus]AQQ87338.1 hypothetical protein AYM14_09410 [Staphylococcus aureus]
MSNTDKYLRDIASELKGIRKELQKQNATVFVDTKVDGEKLKVLTNEPLF